LVHPLVVSGAETVLVDVDAVGRTRWLPVEADLEAHTGRFFVDGVVDARIAPTRNPVTGKPSYARIVLPDGFEYEEAEVGSSSVRTMVAPIKLEWEGQHGHIARLDMTGKGLVRGRAA